MNNSFKTGFKKTASGGKLYNTLELLGLGALAYPSIKKLTTGKDMNENKYHQLEAGGLGILALPAAVGLMKGMKAFKGSKLLSKIPL